MGARKAIGVLQCMAFLPVLGICDHALLSQYLISITINCIMGNEYHNCAIS